jgi:hypothetical protein
MNCCGQKRQQWQQNTLSLRESVPAPADPVMRNPVQLQYKGTNTIMITGKQTGYIYLFAEGETALSVDSRDVEQVLSASTEISLSTVNK